MSYLKTAYTWLMKSSQNPGAVSLTIKGATTGVITAITVVIGLAHISVGTADLNGIVDGAIACVQAAAAMTAAITTVYGAVRKVVLTIESKHASLNAQ